MENKALDFPIFLLLYLTPSTCGVQQPSQSAFPYGIMVWQKWLDDWRKIECRALKRNVQEPEEEVEGLIHEMFFVVSLEQNNYFYSVKEEAPRLTIVLLL